MLAKGILEPQSVLLDDDSPSKKRVLERAAHLLSVADTTLTEGIFERLLERERLGSTGLAGGVALPHARMPGIDDSRGAFMRLTDPVEFDALDGRPVGLVFALLVPEDATDEHLQLLAKLAATFNDDEIRQRLRDADAEQALKILNGTSTPHAA